MQHGLSAGIVGRVAPALTTLARYRVSGLSDSGSIGRIADGELALSVRPGMSDFGALLFSYNFAEHQGLGSLVGDARPRTDRLSMDGLLQLPAQVELYGRLSAGRQPTDIPQVRETGYLAQGRIQRPLFWRFDAAGETRWIRESERDRGRTLFGLEWGTWVTPDLRVAAGWSSGPFAMPGSVLGTTASRGGSYLVISSTLSSLFELMPGAAAQASAAAPPDAAAAADGSGVAAPPDAAAPAAADASGVAAPPAAVPAAAPTQP
jgi:hypothetical protein